MTGFTNYSAAAAASWLTDQSAMPAITERYLGLFTAVGTDAGTGFTEVSGGAYARVGFTGSSFGTPGGTAPTSIASSAALTFAQATANWGTVIAWGLFDAATGGDLLQWDFLGASPYFPFVCTLASPGVLTAYGITAGSTPALADGATVIVTDEMGGALPTGLTRYSLYTVAGLSGDTFNVGVNTTTVGSGMVRQVQQQSIPSGVTASFGSGQITLLVS